MSQWSYETVGEILKKQRKTKNISLEEAASATNISMRFLSALEENQFSKLPAQIHVTGFIRLYGSFLDLEESLLMEKLNYQMMMDEHPPLEEIMTLAKQVQPKNRKINPVFIIFMLILIASVSLVIVYFYHAPPTTEVAEEKNEIWDQEIVLKKGEILEIPSEDELITFKLSEVGTDIVTLIPEKEENAIHYVKQNEYLRYDYNKDYFFDIEITIKKIEGSSVYLSIKKIKELRLKDQDNYLIGFAGDSKNTELDNASPLQSTTPNTSLTALVKNLKNHTAFVWIIDSSQEKKEEMTRLAPDKTMEVPILENQNLKTHSIEVSDLSAIELKIGEQTFKFNKAQGSAGYIQFEIKEENGQKKLAWQSY